MYQLVSKLQGQCNRAISWYWVLTLCLLGYLKPSKSHVWCPNMANDTSLESSYALLLESAKKANLQKLKFFLQNPIKD